jgi:4-amino-4-deoxy-L-arabinose transferase-like glycosyltransferase
MPISFKFSKKIIFFLLIFLAFANFILFGYNGAPPDGDGIQYVAYGKNLALGNGYSIDGKTFDIFREPGYPFFLFFIFKLFGIENLLAVKIIQTMLLALTAFFVFLIFELYDRKKIGFITALLVAAIPSYGHYANRMYIEILFTFLLILSFYLVLHLLKKDENMLFYGITGAVFAGAVLTRMFIIFLPLILGAGLLLIMHKKLRNVIVFYLVFLLLIGGWAGYVYHKTGVFNITQGRQELHLYIRAAHSTLSYKESLYYLYSWIRRSALGGTENEVLGKYDARPLTRQYENMMEHRYPLSRIRAESITTILNNPGHYLFGNVIEWVKLMFIEHLYPPVSPLLGRFVRLSFYILLYGLFLFGSIRFLKHRWQELQPVFLFAIIFLLYNWIVMSFFDAIPRFNTPYLVFYLIIGVGGLASAFKRLQNKYEY